MSNYDDGLVLKTYPNSGDTLTNKVKNFVCTDYEYAPILLIGFLVLSVVLLLIFYFYMLKDISYINRMKDYLEAKKIELENQN